jgi:hypothetical protein
MFGHQDDKKDNEKPAEHQEQTVAPDAPAGDQHGQVNPPAGDQKSAGNLHGGLTVNPPSDHGDNQADSNGSAPGGDQQGQHTAGDSDGDGGWQHPGAPVDDEPARPEPIKDIIGPPGGGVPAIPDHINHYDEPDEGSALTDDSHLPHELIDIKQKALGQLTPLMDELDQAPEDKFRTVMMMIQASDDQNLVKLAYDTANKIKDDKARAQAYLDIVNEINYFTQHPAS